MKGIIIDVPKTLLQKDALKFLQKNLTNRKIPYQIIHKEERPYDEWYKNAPEAINILPKDCIVLTMSQDGIYAAEKAGYQNIVLIDPGPRSRRRKTPDVILTCSSFHEFYVLSYSLDCHMLRYDTA